MEQYHRPLRIVAMGSGKRDTHLRADACNNGGRHLSRYPPRLLNGLPLAPTVRRAQLVKVEEAQPRPQAGVALDVTSGNA